MLLRIRKTLDRKRAFSLIELMITCIIISVLVAMAVPSYMNARWKAEEQKAIATLYAYAQAQKAYWFDQDPNTYCNIFSELVPSYVDVLQDDGDWVYTIDGDTDTFTVEAAHLDVWGGLDTLTLEIDQDWNIDDSNWPY